MGLFDFLKKKPPPAAPPETDLEMTLRRAATEPPFRSLFYHELLRAELVVLAAPGTPEPVDGELPAGAPVELAAFADGRIPVFSSVARLRDQVTGAPNATLLTVAAPELFRLTEGATLLLNPYSDYTKELVPAEIAGLLDGSLLAPDPDLVIAADTPVLVGQPALYPTALLAALCQHFAQRPDVRAAYLAQVHNPADGQPPHLLIGLDVAGDARTEAQEAGHVARAHLAPGDLIDFIALTGQGTDSVEGYMRDETEPFFRR